MSNEESKKEKEKAYRAVIIARAEQSRELRQTALETMEVPKEKSLRQEVALTEEKKKRMTAEG